MSIFSLRWIDRIFQFCTFYYFLEKMLDFDTLYALVLKLFPYFVKLNDMSLAREINGTSEIWIEINFGKVDDIAFQDKI